MKVEQLITNPKKSVIGLSIPMILSLFLTMINNLADAMWVSGLGADALAAIGIVTPLFIFKMQEYHNFCKLWMNCTIGCTVFFNFIVQEFSGFFKPGMNCTF